MGVNLKSGDVYSVGVTVADILEKPEQSLAINKRDSQILFGETFRAEEIKGEWVYGTSLMDGYKGHIHAHNLKPSEGEPDFVVAVPLTHVYPEPSFKTRPVMGLSFMSRIVTEINMVKNGFMKLPGLGWVFNDHVKSLSDLAWQKDITASALLFLGMPYLYGGRSAMGLDCSALVQLSLQRSGFECPRDSDQQVSIGKSISDIEMGRGDLVFFRGHVGIMIDGHRILNATARTMDTRIEELSPVTDHYGGILAIRRISKS